MENGEATFYGMSSMNEYWNRASETDRLEITTSSSEDSGDESKSSNKEYRDASCYVDFDEELNEKVDEDASAIVANSRTIIKLSESKIERNLKLESSRYVRWDVLMGLGLGLWAVLCIVDVLHSEQSVTRDWLFFKFMREKKNVSKTVLVKRPEMHVWWLFHFWPYMWRFIWIPSSVGAYILLILLLIVFCADSRLRKIVEQAAIDNNLDTRIATAKEVKNSIIQNKTVSIRKKSESSRVVRPVIQKVVSIKLVLSPAIHLHAKILSSVQQLVFDIKTIETRDSVVKRRIPNVPTILQPSNRHPCECRKSFTVDQSILGQLYITNCRKFKPSYISRIEAHSIAEASASVDLIDSSTSIFRVQKIYLDVEKYLGKTRKLSNALNSLRLRSIESKRNFTELSTNRETRTRIITSSPAFKNFLLRLKHNSCVS